MTRRAEKYVCQECGKPSTYRYRDPRTGKVYSPRARHDHDLCFSCFKVAQAKATRKDSLQDGDES